jgi:hypothetical protein
MRRLALLAVFALSPLAAIADDESSPTFYVAASESWHYARCIPSGSLTNREEGKTLLYLATPKGDTLLHQFDWYSPRIFISNQGDVVRTGPWPRGNQASHDDLAISFYTSEGKLLKRYSTLDLAGNPKNVWPSVSHYQVIKEIAGFVIIYEKVGCDTLTATPGYGFEVLLRNGEQLVFDVKTGERIKLVANNFTQRTSF